MKGKKYTPVQVFSEFYDVDIGSEFTTFKYPIKSRTVKKFKVNTREFSPVRYMWKSSIPNNWFNLADPSHFYNMRIENKHKNTLQFLEETQKYIYNIRKPLANKRAVRTSKPNSRSDPQGVSLRSSLTRVQSDRKGLATAKPPEIMNITNRHELIPRISSFDIKLNPLV